MLAGLSRSHISSLRASRSLPSGATIWCAARVMCRRAARHVSVLLLPFVPHHIAHSRIMWPMK